MSDRNPSLSIIIPVLHEAATINRFLAMLRKRFPAESCEILVVDGSPRHETIDAISDSSMIKVAAQAGRGRQMNRGAFQSHGEVFLFLHADTLPPARVLPLVCQALKDPRVVGGAFSLAIKSQNPVLWLVAKMTTLRSRFTRLPFGDQGIFIRRTVFERLGGYRDIPIMEDLDLMRRLRYAGLPIVILPEQVSTSSRRWDEKGILLATLQNWLLRAMYYLGVSPDMLAAWYD